MKQINVIFGSVLASAFLFVTACNSSEDKVVAAETKVENAKQDLKEAERLADTANSKAAKDADWKIFIIEAEAKINANKVRIAALKTEINKPGKALDAVYGKRIQILEEKNKTLQNKIGAYEKDQSNWAAFKQELNSELDELGRTLTNFTIKNN